MPNKFSEVNPWRLSALHTLTTLKSRLRVFLYSVFSNFLDLSAKYIETEVAMSTDKAVMKNRPDDSLFDIKHKFHYFTAKFFVSHGTLFKNEKHGFGNAMKVFLLFGFAVLNLALCKYAKQSLFQRMRLLELFARQNTVRAARCSNSEFVTLGMYQFGNSGNNLIEFTHALWVAKSLDRTLVLPDWTKHLLKPFDSTLLHQLFCIQEEETHANASTIELVSSDAFFLFTVFEQDVFKPLLPKVDDKLIEEISLHFLVVYAALWSRPRSALIQASLCIIENALDDHLNYMSAHKRSLEGECDNLLSAITVTSDFSPDELPMDHGEWAQCESKSNSGSDSAERVHCNHPLCTMSPSFVAATAKLNHADGRPIYLSFDGQGDISDYKTLGEGRVVVSSTMPHCLSPSASPSGGHHDNHHGDDRVSEKFVDMLIAMHAGFFILNPRSTFSWEIYLIRVVLGLESVPIIRNNDMYLQDLNKDYKELNRTRFWVTWESVVKAAATAAARPS